MESAEGDMIMSMVMQELKSKDTRTMSSPGVFAICAVFPLQISEIVRQLVAEKCFRSKTYRVIGAGHDFQW